MNRIEERLAKEIRKHEHLYNPLMEDYKDVRVTDDSWKEIADNVDLEVVECMKKWRKMRGRFIRIKKRMKGSSGDAGGWKVPAFYISLSWLEPHLKGRTTSSNSIKVTIGFER